MRITGICIYIYFNFEHIINYEIPFFIKTVVCESQSHQIMLGFGPSLMAFFPFVH